LNQFDFQCRQRTNFVPTQDAKETRHLREGRRESMVSHKTRTGEGQEGGGEGREREESEGAHRLVWFHFRENGKRKKEIVFLENIL
jgi:hypothetical protein